MASSGDPFLGRSVSGRCRFNWSQGDLRPPGPRLRHGYDPHVPGGTGTRSARDPRGGYTQISGGYYAPDTACNSPPVVHVARSTTTVARATVNQNSNSKLQNWESFTRHSFDAQQARAGGGVLREMNLRYGKLTATHFYIIHKNIGSNNTAK